MSNTTIKDLPLTFMVSIASGTNDGNKEFCHISYEAYLDEKYLCGESTFEELAKQVDDYVGNNYGKR